MKFLILEDDPKRHKHFKRNLIGHEVTIKVTVPEITQLLQEKEWDVISLDHDLGGKVFVPSGPDTGFAVAQWLYYNPNRKPKLIVIHSFNEAGASSMIDYLPEASYLPGAWTMTLEEWKKEFHRVTGGIKKQKGKNDEL